ncbi:MAG TPA: hypothetical protein VJB67_03140 [Patescibacteria group bacterium]|nr:hypothetical protein [Patescibacteria group bacterium]
MDLPLNLINFFRPSRLFSLRPAIDINTIYFLLAIFAIMVIIAILIKFFQKLKKPERLIGDLYGKYFSFLLIFGLLGVLMIWFRYERVYILSARFWLLVWGISALIYLYFILRYQFKIIPRAKKNLEQKKLFNKYLPKKR